MREFQKSHKLDHVCYDLRGPVLDEANRMAQNGVQILKLNIGNPAPFHFTAPDEIIQDMQFNLRDAEGYSDSKGIFSARKAIMQYCQLKNIEGVGINDIYDYYVYAGASRQRRRNACACARLSAVDGIRDACRRQRRTLYVR